jgi:hypothetical protein
MVNKWTIMIVLHYPALRVSILVVLLPVAFWQLRRLSLVTPRWITAANTAACLLTLTVFLFPLLIPCEPPRFLWRYLPDLTMGLSRAVASLLYVHLALILVSDGARVRTLVFAATNMLAMSIAGTPFLFYWVTCKAWTINFSGG